MKLALAVSNWFNIDFAWFTSKAHASTSWEIDLFSRCIFRLALILLLNEKRTYLKIHSPLILEVDTDTLVKFNSRPDI